MARVQTDGANAIPIPDPASIPDKLYFRIGEVSRLAGLKPYVLRYWETEFPTICPKKSGTGHRLYRRKDVETVLEIKRLLYDKRFTIEGARKALDPKAKAAMPKAVPVPATNQRDLFPPSAAKLKGIRNELQAILKLLE